MLNRTSPAGQSDSPGIASLLRTLHKASEAVETLTDLVQSDEVLRAAFDAAISLVANRKGRLIISGIGKSGHIGRKIAATMASTGTPAFFVHPTEASHGDLGMIASDDTLLLLSWSGETSELAHVLAYAKRFDIPLIALTSREDSVLGRNADVTLCLPQVAEACPHGLAPTTSTLLQLLVGDALAIALLEHRGFSPQDFGVYHPGGKLGAQLRPVGEIAHTGEEMPIIAAGARMSEALLVMSGKGFGVIGIVDGAGALMGIITDGDLRRHMAPDLLEQRVETVMSTRPRVVDGAMLAARALLLMQSEKITVAFVVDAQRRPQGIVHIHDLLRAGVA